MNINKDDLAGYIWYGTAILIGIVIVALLVAEWLDLF